MASTVAAWPTVALGEVLRKSDDWIDLKPDTEYAQVTVRLWGKGVAIRGRVLGSQIAASRQLRVRTNQFILSRIDARNGAFGLVTSELDGAVVSSDFPVFDLDESRIVPAYLGWMSKTHDFVEMCQRASEGTTNRVRLKEERFLAAASPLPPLEEQRRIVGRIEALAGRIAEARGLRQAAKDSLRQLLLGQYGNISADTPLMCMAEVAPLVRRPIAIDTDAEYPELGVRSFGKGTFHKPPLPGALVGTKKLFAIEPSDLLFNIVFAWEGAVAVAQPEDVGRVGSHRFLTCVPNPELATANYLRFHFLTEEGLWQLGEASPGGAGRNRTLGLKALENIRVPVPPLDQQHSFDALLSQADSLETAQAAADAELDALLPSVLDRAFRGEL